MKYSYIKLKKIFLLVLAISAGIISCNIKTEVYTQPAEQSTDSNNISKKDTVVEMLPETLDEAVDHIISEMDEKDKEIITLVPKYDLIIFHMSWGMGIRNGLGLWGRNDKLLKSCAEKVGFEIIHPDNASGIIMDEVWDKLHANLNLPDFEKVPVDNYFDEVYSLIRKSKNESNIVYLSTLPVWVYETRSHRFTVDNKSDRVKLLLKKAKSLAVENNEQAVFGLLYFLFYNSDLNEIDSLIDRFRLNNLSYTEIPYFYSNHLCNSLLIRPDSTKLSEENKITYKFRKLSKEEFMGKCYGSMYDKYFVSIDDYHRWQKLRKENYLVKWRNEPGISKDDYKRLYKDPGKLLSILVLTNKYAYFDIYNDALTIGAYLYSKKSLEQLISFLKLDKHIFTDYPYDKCITIYGKYDDGDQQQFAYRMTHALCMIADKLTTKELIDMLSPEAITKYNKNLKTEDLADYEVLAGFLFATQYQRILQYPDKEKVFQICYYHWKNEFVSWAIQDYLIELMFRIDSEKALGIFLEYFKEVPTEGSFTRNGILKSIIKYKFKENKEFIENWFWTVYGKKFKYRPREHELILKLLKETNSVTNKLYNKIIDDPRYKDE